MNWKKALLVFVVVVFGFVLLAAAAFGVVAAVGIASVAAILDETTVETVVDSVEEIARDVERVEVTVDVPEVVFTDPESGQSRVIIPDLPGERGRIIVDGLSGEEGRLSIDAFPFEDSRFIFRAPDRVIFGPAFVINQVGHFIRTVFTILGLVLVGLGAWLLLKNRQQPVKEKSDVA
jgi:hypothetical protein